MCMCSGVLGLVVACVISNLPCLGSKQLENKTHYSSMMNEGQNLPSLQIE